MANTIRLDISGRHALCVFGWAVEDMPLDEELSEDLWAGALSSLLRQEKAPAQRAACIEKDI